MKRCARCSETLPAESFGRSSKSPDGLQGWCRSCFRVYLSERHRRLYVPHPREVRERAPRKRKRYPRKWVPIPKTDRVCVDCGDTFQSWTSQRLRCDGCRAEKEHRRKREQVRLVSVALQARLVATERTCPECGSAFNLAGRRPRRRFCSEACGKSFHDMQSRHRRRSGPTGGYFLTHGRAIIFERDGWRCGICHRKVKRSEATIDHIIPVKAGGSNGPENLQTAHSRCNSRKGVGLGQLRGEWAA